MRVIASTPITIRPDARRARALNLELAGLLAASLVLVFGSVLTIAARLQRLAEQPKPLLISSIKAPEELEAALATVEVPQERRTLAQAIYRHATNENVRLEHVGGLAGVGGLRPAQIAAIKPFLAVRSSG
jgi:hypothetical protein